MSYACFGVMSYACFSEMPYAFIRNFTGALPRVSRRATERNIPFGIRDTYAAAHQYAHLNHIPQHRLLIPNTRFQRHRFHRLRMSRRKNSPTLLPFWRTIRSQMLSRLAHDRRRRQQQTERTQITRHRSRPRLDLRYRHSFVISITFTSAVVFSCSPSASIRLTPAGLISDNLGLR